MPGAGHEVFLRGILLCLETIASKVTCISNLALKLQINPSHREAL